MTFWLDSGESQKFGAAISASIFSNWARLLGASKIAPHSFSLLAVRGVLPLEFFQGHKL